MSKMEEPRLILKLIERDWPDQLASFPAAGDAATFPSLDEMNRWWSAVACEETGQNVDIPSYRFTEQQASLTAVSYESGIAKTGAIPTRTDNWHDLFNALVWIRYTRIKRTLNRAHLNQLDSAGKQPGVRNRMRDYVTLVDETGIVLCGSRPEHERMIRQHDWHALFVDCRADWHSNLHAFVIGHGLLEQLLTPYVGLTAKALFLEVDHTFNSMKHADKLTEVDHIVAKRLKQETGLCETAPSSSTISNIKNASSRLLPLPILGIPGWWPANEDHIFYKNQNYFRPLRVTTKR